MLHRRIGYGFLAGIAGAFISSVALASILTPSTFTVTPSAIPGVVGFAPFTATFKQFGYTAVVTQQASGAFTETGGLNISNFATPDTLGVIPSATTGLGAAGGYSLYETFTATGFAAPVAGGIHVTFTDFTMTLLGHAGPGFAVTLNAAGVPVVPAGSVTLGTSTSLLAGEGRVFSPALANGDFDILGTFKPSTGFLSGSVFTGSATLGALYDLNGVTTLICGGITLTCGAPGTIVSGLPPFGTAFTATLIGSGNQSFAPVPEPASVLLLGSGLAGLGLYSFRRRKANQI